MSVKKAFQPIVNLLSSNLEATVGDIIDQVVTLASAQRVSAESKVHRNKNGEVVAILDHYFKQWLPVDFVTFGDKKSSSTGLNTMSKEGQNHWANQQRIARVESVQLMDSLLAGDITVDEANVAKTAIETSRDEIRAFSMPELAFDSIDDLKAMTRKDMRAIVKSYETEELSEAA